MADVLHGEHYDAGPAPAPPLGRLERLPKWLNLIPMITQWLWLSLRFRSISLPSSCNPAILGGGMVGEGKLDYLAIMGPHALAATAATTSIVAQRAQSLAPCRDRLAAAGIAYPLVAKPNIGWCGFGVRLLRDEAGLGDYLTRFPPGETVVLQRFLPEPGEAGIFYARRPGEARGKITGILLRHYPRVTGDGVRTAAALIAADPRLSRLGRDGLSEPCCDLALRPAAGDIVRVATIGSTRVGGLYEDGTHLATPALTAAIDAIARDMTDFHAGRFDVRFAANEGLARGEGFTIIEVNGAGSEAVHAWDPKYNLRQAYGIVFAKQRLLFEIGDAMRRRGHRPYGWIRLFRLHFRQQALIKLYPPSN